MKKYLIAGLGNIGAEYAETRHNIGFKILDALAGASNISFKTDRYADRALVKIKNKELVLIKPSTYMNLSGKAVSEKVKSQFKWGVDSQKIQVLGEKYASQKKRDFADLSHLNYGFRVSISVTNSSSKSLFPINNDRDEDVLLVGGMYDISTGSVDFY